MKPHSITHAFSSKLGKLTSTTLVAFLVGLFASVTSVASADDGLQATVNTPAADHAPAIAVQPVSQLAALGDSVTFNVVATGTPAPTYQWKFNEAVIPDATNASYTISHVTTASAGSYTVTAKNSTGLAISLPAILLIKPEITTSAQTSSTSANLTTDPRDAVASAATVPGTAIITTLAGQLGVSGSSNTAGTFNSPSNLVADTAGALYVSDSGNHIIRKISSTGTVTTFAGTVGVSGSLDGTGLNARFNDPTGIAIDSTGNLFVASSGSSTIRKITSAGLVSTFAGSTGLTGSTDGAGAAALFNHPTGLTLDSGDNLYVADTGNHTIRKITPSGTVTTLAGQAGLQGTADGSGLTARFSTPLDLAIDSSANLYVADTGNHTIRKITISGISVTVSTVAGTAGTVGSADGIGTAATFNAPAGVVIDRSGELYITDSNHVIRQFTPSTAQVITLAGLAGTAGAANGTGTSARFNFPTGLAIDANNYVYVADTDNHAIRTMISQAPIITTQPSNQIVSAGKNATFTVVATGQPLPIYQWYKDNVAIAGATSATLTLTKTQGSDAGIYKVTATNSLGAVTSNGVSLGFLEGSSSGGGGGGAASEWFFVALALLGLVKKLSPSRNR